MDKQKEIGKKAFIASALVGFGLALYFMISKRNKGKTQSRPAQKFGLQNLGMERYVFNLASDEGIIEAVVEQCGDCYSVILNGKHAGTMWRDESRGMQWKTEDKDLEPHMWEISVHLSEAFSRGGFPSLLMGTYPEILSTNWKTSETLEVIVKEDTNMGVFSTFLKHEVLNLVTFEEHIDLIVKKENNSYFVIVGIN